MTMRNFYGFTKPGRDYSIPTRELLPDLLTSPKTIAQVAAEVGRDYESARSAIAKLRKQAPSQIRIAAWIKDSDRYCPAAAYKWEVGEDEPRPKATTSAEKSRKYREKEDKRKLAMIASRRWLKSPAGADYLRRRYERIKARKEAVKRAKEILRQHDPLLAAIMGRAR